MSAAAVSAPPAIGESISPLGFLKLRPDFIVLVLALPVFVVADWPLVAWATVAVVWTLQAVLQFTLEAKASTATNPSHVIGLLAGSALVRGWSVATGLLILGLLNKDAALYAIVLTLVLFTIYFTARVFTRLMAESDAVAEAVAKEADES
jgi:hypothetical protein